MLDLKGHVFDPIHLKKKLNLSFYVIFGLVPNNDPAYKKVQTLIGTTVFGYRWIKLNFIEHQNSKRRHNLIKMSRII
ncbi:hypothetical protein BpHYR1_013553 [Brachionus plicatilis]|uniref:Uncharacterized protein n=1 Tax=Brachionus plicatilis TaxID=10195 RepID=A0A3M7P1N0_BRAPC|nr:hypothetical protein BpHYR1_013553 [Brachionus plicatilis]